MEIICVLMGMLFWVLNVLNKSSRRKFLYVWEGGTPLEARRTDPPLAILDRGTYRGTYRHEKKSHRVNPKFIVCSLDFFSCL